MSESMMVPTFYSYKYLVVNLVFSHLGFWSGNLFLIAPFPDRCLLVFFLFCCLGPELSRLLLGQGLTGRFVLRKDFSDGFD